MLHEGLRAPRKPRVGGRQRCFQLRAPPAAGHDADARHVVRVPSLPSQPFVRVAGASVSTAGLFLFLGITGTGLLLHLVFVGALYTHTYRKPFVGRDALGVIVQLEYTLCPPWCLAYRRTIPSA